MKLPEHKCGLFLTHNEHRDYYEKAEEWINDHEMYSWSDDAAKRRAIETDEVWTLQWYPDTPVGFYSVAAPTLEELLKLANGAEAPAADSDNGELSRAVEPS